MSTKSASLAMQRIAKLVDENTFMEIGSLVTARSTDFNLSAKKSASDGVITGHGLVNGNLVFIYSQDESVLNGTIGEMHAKKIANIYDMAMKMGAPVIGLIDCAGIRLQESVDALEAFGLICAKQAEASGLVPQICGIFGECGGGFSIIPALCDFTFIEENKGKMFVNAPDAVKGNAIEKCDTSDPVYQADETGCIDFVGSEDEIMAEMRVLVSMLPLNNEGDVYTDDCRDDLNRSCVNLSAMKGDPRCVLAEISDEHVFFECKADYAEDMVTGFIKLNGMTVGAVANCTEVYDAEGNKVQEYDGALTVEGCEKASEFIQYCDAFSIPLLTLTNVNGFSNRHFAEKHLAKALAKFTYSIANATCAKVNLITGQAFGSAYAIMNSKSLGADLVYAWSDARVGMMDSAMAAKIIYPDADADELKAHTERYDSLQSSVMPAAERGYIDVVIEPEDTRKYLVAAFEMLYTKYLGETVKKHGTK